MTRQELFVGSVWFGEVIFSISCKQSSKTLPEDDRELDENQDIKSVRWAQTPRRRTDIDIVLRTRLYPSTVISLGKLFPIFGIYLTPKGETQHSEKGKKDRNFSHTASSDRTSSLQLHKELSKPRKSLQSCRTGFASCWRNSWTRWSRRVRSHVSRWRTEH